MKEYMIMENIPNARVCEQELNRLAERGWTVSSFGQFQILLEREKQDDNKTVEQING